MRKFLPLLFFTACDNSWGPGSDITAIGDERWKFQVNLAAKLWNEASIDCGEVLNVVESNGHPVKLYSGEGWPDNLAGRFDGESVRVRINLGGWELPVLMHELGHSLGLSHVSESEDGDSIMNPSVTTYDQITIGDIVRAKISFGCF